MIVSSSIPLPELISMANLKKHAPIRDRLRAVIYALQNDTAEEIAQQLDRPASWVQGWVYRYRDFGIEGLKDLPRSGKPPKLAPHELTQFIVRVLEGPQKRDEVFAFVGRDFKKILLEEFEQEFSLSGVYKLLHSIGFSGLMPRPRHEKNDPKVMKEWLEEAPRFVRQLQKKNRKRYFRFGSWMK